MRKQIDRSRCDSGHHHTRTNHTLVSLENIRFRQGELVPEVTEPGNALKFQAWGQRPVLLHSLVYFKVLPHLTSQSCHTSKRIERRDRNKMLSCRGHIQT